MGMILMMRAATDNEITRLLNEPSGIEAFVDDEHGGPTKDLDKAWDGLHFLLTRHAAKDDPTLTFLLQGGDTIGDIDVGYGPARAFRGIEVRAIHGALARLSAEQLRARYDGSAMMNAKIYPLIWDRTPGVSDALGYLLSNFDKLRHFVAELARDGSGVLVWLT